MQFQRSAKSEFKTKHNVHKISIPLFWVALSKKQVIEKLVIFVLTW